jgi:uncharacterized protein with HEPN domain
MSRRYPELLLDDMLESIQSIQDYTGTMSVEALLDSKLHKDAIIRNLEVLGEAANQLTTTVHALAPDIPWPKLIGLRNRLIHEYHGINWDVLIPIVLNDLSTLKDQLIALQAIAPKVVEYDNLERQ